VYLVFVVMNQSTRNPYQDSLSRLFGYACPYVPRTQHQPTILPHVYCHFPM
jgi:hypothetical protein